MIVHVVLSLSISVFAWCSISFVSRVSLVESPTLISFTSISIQGSTSNYSFHGKGSRKKPVFI